MSFTSDRASSKVSISVVSCQLSVVSRQLSVVRCPASVVSSQFSVKISKRPGGLANSPKAKQGQY
ncbi:MAG: hypothetical protein DMG25_00180 [Acidobacteria bacterium]|nr:MAG: hypothetical protein DMG25_00180 [Acidobacteriota bacterium]